MTATLTWSEIVETTSEQVKASRLVQLADAGYTATSWQPFSEQLLAVEIASLFGADASKIAVYLKSGFFSSTAEGEALTRLSASNWLNERVKASASTRMITLTCSATEGPHPIGLNDLIIQHADGHTFRNEETEGITYPTALASGGTITLLFECDTPGAQSNVPDQTVNILLTTLAGVTITNDVLEEEGVDEETDERLRARNESKWSELSELQTIDDLVLSLALRASPNITAIKVDNLNPRGVGTWDVYIAGALATASSADVNAMQAMLNARTMDPSLAKAFAAPAFPLDITGTVYYSSGAVAAQVQAAVEEALENYLKTIPLGGFDFSPGPNNVVPLNNIETAIKSALYSGVSYVRTVALTTPAGDFGVTSYGKVTRGTWNLTYTPTTASVG